MPFLRPLGMLLAVLILGGCANAAPHNADALWQLISQKCVPGMAQKGEPAPCQSVDVKAGFVTLKDRRGVLQYLVMPTTKITGMESPLLLKASTPHFFALAWQQRQLASQNYGHKVPDRDLSLAINSAYGRSQNQLHVHISCLRPALRQQLDALAPGLGRQWQSQSLMGHPYLLRTLSPNELGQQSVFMHLAEEVPGAKGEMGRYGMAMATLPDGQLLLMATRAGSGGSQGSAEEIQDHDCAIVKG